jgi:hypothetical protein
MAAVGTDASFRSIGGIFGVPLLIQYFAFGNSGMETVINRNWIAFFVPGADFSFPFAVGCTSKVPR